MRLIDTTSKDTLTGTKSGVGETRGYSFDTNNAFFFRSMIDGLYADKESSVVREIIANAFDAHAMAKVPVTRPVEVSLPTMFSQNFVVRDFGDGMPHDFVMELYTRLGHSAKTKTNAATGMFGLGAKTPFAVADAFEVRVYDNGDERVYQCAFANNGCPELTHVQTIKTAEPNGVKIVVPITDRNKQASFERAVVNAALCYFDKDIKFNRPSSNGDNFITSAKSAVTQLTPSFFYRSGGTHRMSSDQILVRQGFAVYPLDLRQITLNRRFLAGDDILRSLGETYHTEVMVDCPIGTFEVTPSRELIQYTQFSKQNLSKMVSAALDAAREELYKKAGGAKTVGEFVKNMLPSTFDPADPSRYPETLNKLEFFGDHVANNFIAWAKSKKLPVAARNTNYSARYSNGFDTPHNDFTKTGKFAHGAHRAAQWANSIRPTIGVTGVTAYDGITSNSDRVCEFDKTDETTINVTDLIIFVPNDIRNWEDKVHHYIRATQKQFVLTTSNISSVVFRGPRDELAIVEDWVAAHHVALHTLSASNSAALVDPPAMIAARNNRVVKPRPAQNDAYLLDNTGSWELQKAVDFTQSCYVIIRDRRHGNIELGDAAMRAAFAAKKLGAAGTFTGLTLKDQAAENTIVSAVREARRTALIDTRPIYSLRRAQAEALIKDGVSLDMLVPTLVNAAQNAVHASAEALKLRSILVGQDWSAGATAGLRALFSASGRNDLTTQLASVLAGDLLCVTRIALHSAGGASSGGPIVSDVLRTFTSEVRVAATKHDVVLNSLFSNFNSFATAQSATAPLPHLTDMIYPLITSGLSDGNLDRDYWMTDALVYAELINNKVDATHAKHATDLINMLPSRLRSVIVEEVKHIRKCVATAMTALTKKNAAVQKSSVAA